MSASDLAGKVAVVTGSGQGLGRAYAVALARAGAAVVVNDLDVRAAEETAALAGGRTTAVGGDVGDRAAADALVVRAVEAFGRLDVMVTNAGVLRDAVLWKMTDEDFDLVVRTHLRGTFLCARAAAIRMREQAQGGRIIVVGSPAGQYGNFGQTNYAAAKAGIVGFARTWALELARAEITVNAIVPDGVDGDDRDDPDLQAARRARRGRRAAAGRGAPRARDRHARGLRGPGRVPRVRRVGRDHRARRSGSAATALSSTRTRRDRTELRDGGWDADAIAAIWQAGFASHAQPFGIRLPQTGHSMTIDVEAIRAIDVHTHAQVPVNGEADPRTTAFLDAASKHFRSEFPRPNAQQVADQLPRALDGGGGLLRRQPAQHR
jgi:3-oxoacyl-[acyl-carrier protein] reductase